MSFLTILLILMSAAPHQKEFNKAMQLFSERYGEEISVGELFRSTDVLSSGKNSRFSYKATQHFQNASLKRNLRSLPITGFAEFRGKDNLIIGDTTAETLFVTGTYSIPMDIYIINDGVMLLRNADLSIDGNVTLFNHGKFDCDSSQVHFLQHYIYNFNIFIQDTASFIVKNSSTTFNHFPIGLTSIGNSKLVWKNVYNRDWTTGVVFGDAIDSLDNVSIAGEWLISDRSVTSFKDTDTLLVWFFFPDSSVVDFIFPDGDTVNGFTFDSTLSNVSGIPYRTEIDNCVGVMWGMIPLAGSDITISDSKLRTTGLMFNSDSSSVSGLVNGLTYSDFTLPLQDRTYHLINTYVNTWSFYPADSSYLEITSSIFGECVGMGNCSYLVQNAFCDGSGGHIETTDNVFGMIFLSSLSCDVISGKHSIMFIAYSSIMLGNIWATGSSIMVLVNSSIPDVPQALDTSIVFVDAVTGPSTASTYETVPVSGSATVFNGPFQPGGFDNYSLFYRASGESLWVAFDSTHHSSVYNGILGVWNTDTLQPGYYELRCLLVDTYGDSIEATKQVNLLPGAITQKEVSNSNSIAFVLKSKRKSLTIRGFCSDGEVSLYDISGRCLKKKMIKKGDEVVWYQKRSGIYFVGFNAESRFCVKKAVLF